MLRFNITNFMLNFLIISSFVLVLLLIKKALYKHINARWHYNLWLLLLALLIVSLVPGRTFHFNSLYHWIRDYLNPVLHMETDYIAMNYHSGNQIDNIWLQDFTQSVSGPSPEYISCIFFAIWFAGLVFYTFVTALCNRDIKAIRKSIKPIMDAGVNLTFTENKIRMGISGKHLELGESPLIQTPMTIGVFKAYIVLPTHIMRQFSEKEVEFMLMHELSHYKNRDILVNCVMCFLQMIYWFHPFVYFAFRQMKRDREIACDASVLSMLDRNSYYEYGSTIIHCAETISILNSFSVAAEINGSRKQIKKRIKTILDFRPESRPKKYKSLGIFLLAGILFTQAPVFSAISYENAEYVFHADNVLYEDLSSYFSGFEGSFVLYDLKNDQYIIHNKDRSVCRVSPDSTYKIYGALIALETGTIKDGTEIRIWDGTLYPYKAWNHDQDLSSAMMNSVSWYFQELDRGVGLDRLRRFFAGIGYGNHNLSGGIGNYWAESSLLISPVEQVQLLRGFYCNDFKFKQQNIDRLKAVIRLSEKNGAILSGKTGTGAVNGKSINGWFIGYVERNRNVYIFATNIQSQDKAAGGTAANITLSILRDKGIYW